MAIFNSYVSHNQRVSGESPILILTVCSWMGMICHILLSTSSAKQKELKHRLGTELDLFLWKPMLLNDERPIVRLHNWGIWIWTVVRASSRAMHSSSMRTSRRPPQIWKWRPKSHESHPKSHPNHGSRQADVAIKSMDGNTLLDRVNNKGIHHLWPWLHPKLGPKRPDPNA